ncbi:MAG: hypothetical protein ACHP7N_13695 [Caulobacterales bacterium]
MPRPWSEYTARERRRLRPLVDRYKHARYQARMALHLRRPPASGDLGSLKGSIAGRRVIITIAFNDSEVVGWQAPLIARHVSNCYHLIADNSSDDEAARRIEAIARLNGCGYLRLPRGPWTKPEDGGRSHGLAMTWTWRNLVRLARPAAFGFIDHDIFPMKSANPFEPLATHAVAGRLRRAGETGRWNLWAGFCFYRFDAVQAVDLDFSLDWAAGLDTGGGNWARLYRRLDAEQVFDTGVSFEAVDPGASIDIARFEWIGDWLHKGNFSTPLDLAPGRREALLARKRALLLERLTAARETAA